MTRYRELLNQALSEIADFPEIGPRLHGIVPGFRAKPVDHHVMYSRIGETEIEIVRILHERADARRLLGL